MMNKIMLYILINILIIYELYILNVLCDKDNDEDNVNNNEIGMNKIYIGVIMIIILSIICGLFFLFYPIISITWKNDISTYPEEMCFPIPSISDPNVWGWASFNSILEEPTKSLSIIIPAYNEQYRIGVMLDEAIGYLVDRSNDSKNKFTFEIIVVDDGSKDDTCKIVLGYVKKYGSDMIRLLKLSKNCGKGGAVQRGMLRGRGEYLLMVDADGATKFSDIERLERGITRIENGSKNSASIAVGSRAHMNISSNDVNRHPIRSFVSKIFHLIVTIFIGTSIIDTQCGFKLFSRKAARLLFPNQHIQRWAFDIELLYLVYILQIPITEEAVNWTEIPGSKLNIMSASIQMVRDLILIRLCYAIGIWKVKIQ